MTTHAQGRPQQHAPIGSAGAGREALVAKVSGRGRYPPDYHPPGMLHAAVLHSLEPHARVERVDSSAASRLPGVEAVVTRADLGWDDRVRHYGDFVAAVAADSAEVAEEAVRALDARLRPLPATFDPLATSPAEPLYAEHPDNVTLSVERVVGDPDAALAAADVRLELSFRTGRPAHCNLSPRCCVARELPNGTLEIVTAVNAPFFARKELAEELGIPAERIRIVVPELMPSSFGGRSGIAHMCEPIAAALAMRTGGRPVRLCYDHDEEFVAGHTRHPVVARIAGAATADGDLEALDIDLVADHAGHANFVARIVLANCRDRILDLYRLAHYRFRGRAVVTNNLPAGEMRGIGSTQIMFLVGSFVDELARRVGMDPLEFQLRNTVRPGHRVPDSGKVLSRPGAQECLAAGRDMIGWPAPRAAIRSAGPAGRRRRGVGVAVGTHTTGLGTFHGPDASRAAVAVETDGGVVLRIAAPDSGQGSNGVYAQIAARELGVPYGMIRVSPIDTETAPYDPWGSVASRGVYVVGTAVGLAATRVRRRLVEAAGAMLGADAGALAVRDGRVVVPGLDGPGPSLAEIVATTGPIEEEAGSAMEENPPTYGACFVEVEVDVDTGEVRVTRATSVVDVGAVLSPESCRSQIEGALAQGIEYALGSEVVLENGVPGNASFADYRLFQARDLPAMEVVMLETPETSGPYGARGVGTPAIVPVAAAVCNAIRSAVGVRVTELPVRPEVLWSKIRDLG